MTNTFDASGPSGDVHRGANGVLSHLRSDYITTALYFTRIGTIISCIAFFFAPMFSHQHSSDLESWYRRAMLASAATSALRLHQRMKTLNSCPLMTVLGNIVSEDPFHYLLYSIMFTLVTPVTVSLVPVFLFAVLHVTSFTQTLLNISAPRNYAATGDGPNTRVTAAQPSALRNLLQKLTMKVKANNQLILRVIALNEIMLMVICIFMAVAGPRIIILPLIYYPFLKMRYNSRRNPYTRNAFYELRMVLQNVACNSRCPALISRLIYGLINLVSRLGSAGYART